MGNVYPRALGRTIFNPTPAIMAADPAGPVGSWSHCRLYTRPAQGSIPRKYPDSACFLSAFKPECCYPSLAGSGGAIPCPRSVDESLDRLFHRLINLTSRKYSFQTSGPNFSSRFHSVISIYAPLSLCYNPLSPRCLR